MRISNRITEAARSSVKRKLAVTAASAVLLANTLLAAPGVVSAAANRPSAWAQEDSYEARKIGLVPNELWGNFQSAITRAELSNVIVHLYERLSGRKAAIPSSNPFNDTTDLYVVKAYALGIIGGTGGGKFSPDALVTREQLAVMLYNTLVKAGLQDALNQGEPAAFADAGTIAGWASEAAAKLAGAGIMQGAKTSAGLLFQPKANASREQIYVLAYRVAEGLGPVYVNSEYDLLEAVEHRGKPIIFEDDRARKIYDEAVRINSEIIKPGMSEFDKELAIHDYIVLHTAYDYSNFLADTIPDDSYSAYGVLFKGTAVCQGYAYAAHLMLELAGIDSQIVTGEAGGVSHAWNKVKIGGEYYNLDVTWDDPVPDASGRTIYSYFNVTDEQLAKNHTWEMSQYPAATATALNYYESKGLAVHSAEELKSRLNAAIAARAATLTFRADYEGDVRSDMIEVLQASGVVSRISYSYSGTAYVLTLEYRG